MATARSLRQSDIGKNIPVYVVWEITLRCDHACAHCGSRAGPATRDDELSTEEMFEVGDALARLGTREVTLIGGEAYLRGDCYDLIRHLTKQGIRVTMQSGGRGLTATRCRKLKEAGLAAIGVSIDGPAEIHDVLRNAEGSFESAMNAVQNARDAGMIVTTNSQVNRANMHVLRDIAMMMKEAGVLIWRAQMTAPMGAAADRPEWILQPYHMLRVLDTLADVQKEVLQDAHDKGIPLKRAFRIAIGNNLGYYGPHEQLLRSRPEQERYWQGCQAGKYVMGIESDGALHRWQRSRPVARGHLEHHTRSCVHARPRHERAVGILQELLLRRRVPGGLLVHDALDVGQAGEQPALLAPRQRAQEAGETRDPAPQAQGARRSLRLRVLRARHRGLE